MARRIAGGARARKQTELGTVATYEDLPSWRRPPEPALAVERQIRRDIRDAVPDLRIVVTEGDPTDVILEVAAREQCDLIVTGIARDQGVGRVVLGRIVEFLIRKAPISVLVVKSRMITSWLEPISPTKLGTDWKARPSYFPKRRLR
jgi:nucleotide-binding universal stress UspA family protein